MLIFALLISQQETREYTVTASVYNPIRCQTTNHYWQTADGSVIDTMDPFKHRWIGLSRNLLKRWGGPFVYGDKVRIQGVNAKLDGIYTVRDCMNSRYTNCIDILVGQNDKCYGHWKNVKLIKVK